MAISLDQAFADATALIAPDRRLTMLRVEGFTLRRFRIPPRGNRQPGAPDLEIIDQPALFEFIDARRQNEAQAWTGPRRLRQPDRFDARKLGDAFPRLYWTSDFLGLCTIIQGQEVPRKGPFSPQLATGGGFSMEIALHTSVAENTATALLRADATNLYSGSCEGDVLDRLRRPIAHVRCEVSFRPVQAYLFG